MIAAKIIKFGELNTAVYIKYHHDEDDFIY